MQLHAACRLAVIRQRLCGSAGPGCWGGGAADKLPWNVSWQSGPLFRCAFTYLRLFISIEERIRNTYNGVENTVCKDIHCLHLHIYLLLWMRILSNHKDPIKVHWLSKTVGYFLRLYYLLFTFNIYRGYFQKHNLTHKPLTDLECLHTEAGLPAAAPRPELAAN